MCVYEYMYMHIRAPQPVVGHRVDCSRVSDLRLETQTLLGLGALLSLADEEEAQAVVKMWTGR